MNEFLDLVTERPDKSLRPIEGLNKCPYCRYRKLTSFGTSSTLTGGDNHQWTDYLCRDCLKSFVVEDKGSNAWIVEKNTGKILRGIPTCFETYVYTCKHCGGDVRRHYYKLDEDVYVDCLVTDIKDGKSIKRYRSVFKCDDCGEQVESENDYYQKSKSSIEKIIDRCIPRKLSKHWTVVEEIGIGIITPPLNPEVEGVILEAMTEQVKKDLEQKNTNNSERWLSG